MGWKEVVVEGAFTTGNVAVKALLNLFTKLLMVSGSNNLPLNVVMKLIINVIANTLT